MANLDTREKRASAWGFLYTVPPLPDGTIGAADRKQISWFYVGIALVEPEPVVQRRNLTKAQYLDLEVRQRNEGVRFELLDANLQSIRDLHPVREIDNSPVYTDIEANTEAAIFRVLSGLVFTPSEAAYIDTFASRIKAWWVIQGFEDDPDPLGVFMFQSRDLAFRDWGGLTYCSTLIDQSWIIDQPRRSSYSIRKGEVLTDHLRTLASEAGITDLSGIENSAIVAGNEIVKPQGTTTRAIMAEINRLLAYYPPHYNNIGRLSCRSVPDLDLATADHVYGSGEGGRIIAGSIVISDKGWDAPNEVVVVNTAATAGPVVGSASLPSDAPNSELHRGYKVTKIIDEPGVQDEDQANALAKAAFAQGAGSYRYVEYDSPPDPRHDLFAIVGFDELNHREAGWRLRGAPGGPHHHSLRGIFN